MVEITSRKDLENWLQDKPREYAQVIAARAALRALPYAFDQRTGQKWINEYALNSIRATAISWAALNFPAHDMTDAAYAAADAAARGSAAARSSAYVAAYAGVASAYAYAGVAALADAARAAADVAAYAGVATAAACACVAALARAADDDDARAAVWDNVSADCDWLGTSSDGATDASRLTREPLWLRPSPDGWQQAWDYAATRLTTINPSYQVWIDCYNRRIIGKDAAFDIPGDTNRTEDKKILARLADATDEDFWNNGATHVNTTLQSWIDNAKARLIDWTKVFEPADDNAEIPPQNRNAVSFRTNADGRISIDPTAAGALRTDADARDRHAEAVREAQALLERCRGSNAGARLTQLLENYLAAAGEAVEDIRASLMVQRGEKLRQEIAALATPDSLLDPLADDILVDLKGWQSAHNMTVGLDPVLIALDASMLGPDVKPALISPDELRMLARDADHEGVTEAGVLAVLEEAADLAPTTPDPTDRRTIWSVETGKNLVIEAMSVALNHPVKTVVGVAAVGLIVPTMSAFDQAQMFAFATVFLLKNRNFIESKLGNTPTWKSLFIQLCDRIEKAAPFKRGSGDE